MKNLISTSMFLFVFVTLLHAQTALVDNFLTVTDGAGGSQTLNFGLDTAATDGIDTNLDEAPLPPLPPSGVFDTRFNLPGGLESSHKDFRQGNIPYNGEKIHELQYQVGSGTIIQIDWDLPADSSVKGRLQDVVLGTLIDVLMIGQGSYTVTNPSVFNKLKMTITYIDVIPVELTSFTGKYMDNSVTLAWSTATETNNRGFEIERSLTQTLFQREGFKSWERIGFVQGYGSSTVQHYYTFNDNKLNGGNKFYYRLKQIDFNGQYEYSETVEVEIIASKFILYQNYPNPFNPSTTIKYSLSSQRLVTIKIYNVLGNEVAELVNEIKPAGIHEINFDATQLSSGIYLYKLQAGSFVATRKMILLR